MSKLYKYLILGALAIVFGICDIDAQEYEYDFINHDANHITMNGADWNGLRRLAASRRHRLNRKLKIVQIGDSHIQPGILSGEARRKLQARFGNGGRGLIAPLALSGTNEPTNYVLRSSASVSSRTRLLNRDWPVENGLTGVAVRLSGSTTDLTIRDKTDDEFTFVTLLHAPRGGYNRAIVNGEELLADSIGPYASRFALSEATSEVTLSGVPCPGAFWGAVLSNDLPGVVYSEIGNNGATYSSYCKIDNFARELSLLEPDLVILSMGTNEAVGNVEVLESGMDRLISAIRAANPRVVFLLTTPMEFQRRQGGRFMVSANAHRARDIVMEYGQKHGIAVWDMFTVSGGDGHSDYWIREGLMNSRDHLHLLVKGYELQGRLFGDALVEALDTPVRPSIHRTSSDVPYPPARNVNTQQQIPNNRSKKR